LRWQLSFLQLPSSKIIDTKIVCDSVQPGREFHSARIEPVSRHPKSNKRFLGNIFRLDTVNGHAPGIIEYALGMQVEDLPEGKLATGKYLFDDLLLIFLNH